MIKKINMNGLKWNSLSTNGTIFYVCFIMTAVVFISVGIVI